MRRSVLPIIAIVFFLASCNNEPKEGPLNPNGDSELALLMRQMYEDGMQVKQAILEKKKNAMVLQHEKILTAKATQPEKADNHLYRSFASSYIQLMNQLNEADISNRKENYSNLVNSCMQCHQNICPGPMVRIKKMVLN